MSKVDAIKGLVALVTGGSSGLGRGAVQHLHKNGARVAIFDLPTSKGAEVASELGQNALFIPTDVTNEKQVEVGLQEIRNQFGQLNAVINCAGIAYAFRLYNSNKRVMSDMENYRRTLEVNVLGTINVIRQSVHMMMDQKLEPNEERGVVINTSSVAAFDGQIGQTAYTASKGAIHSMTLPLARELAHESIRVCTIAPGVFETPLLMGLPPKVQKFLSSLTAFPNRLGYPAEFAALVQHIIENKYINGETIRLDAGLRMPA
ncbi:Oxidoreductase, short chain dehydrogenase/reductase family protein [Aphelenchoides besseyi]|nr:Oxidoreductase, short chain dehydrogenase/reductase family protein [Aphelenchoides besseyi]KAI6212173.1 Oxidoreductase, short chain dehydrogenase/reductase family protein [Aphelenchoides besseyi]